MKICAKCGAQQSDERIFCVDCGDRLGDSLPPQAEQIIYEKTRETVDKLYNSEDPLHVSIFDRIIGYISLGGLAASLVCTVIIRFGDDESPNAFSASFTAAVFFLCAALDALVPNLLWSLERFRLSFTMDGTENLSPSSFYTKMRRFGICLLFVIGVVALMFALQFMLTAPAADDPSILTPNGIINEYDFPEPSI